LATIIVPSLILLIQDIYCKQHILQIDFTNPKEVKSNIKRYYAKDFMSNSPFVNYYLQFKTDVLRENPIPHNVISGQNGWYFLGNNYLNTLNDAYGNDRFSYNELVAIENKLTTFHNYLKSKNIPLYIVIAPNKNNIYKEYLPYKLKQGETKLEQLQGHLQDSKISFINLTQYLKSSKPIHQLYYKTDSHWNTFGAFLAYQNIIAQMQSRFQIKSQKLSNYEVDDNFEIAGDLTRLLKINTPEKSIYIKKANDNLSEDYTKPYLRYTNPNNNLKLLMFRDSFANHLIPFFNDTFSETLYLKNYTFNKDLIDTEKPDVVVIEIVERDLRTLINLKN